MKSYLYALNTERDPVGRQVDDDDDDIYDGAGMIGPISELSVPVCHTK